METQAAIFSSPLPGTVVKILAREGECVEPGQSVFVLESMKMLHTLRASRRGYMRHMSVREGETVSANRQLARLV
jgi:biotin carboxyl carrier protein